MMEQYLLGVTVTLGLFAAGASEGQEPAKAASAEEVEIETLRDCPDCPIMVVIPAGSFRMGDISDSGDGRAKPVHEVTLSSFAIGATEVTFAQFDACVDAGACSYRPKDERFGRGDMPVMNVNVHDAREYAAWLSKRTGQSYRLPSEAEWEYAARAGTQTRYWWGDVPRADLANFNAHLPYYGAERGQYRRRTSATGSLPASPWGLHDILGNVFEWVEDCWHPTYEGAPTDGSAWMTDGDCNRAIVRGGSWHHLAPDLRAAYRGRYNHTLRVAGNGFRVARDIGKPNVAARDIGKPNVAARDIGKPNVDTPATVPTEEDAEPGE